MVIPVYYYEHGMKPSWLDVVVASQVMSVKALGIALKLTFQGQNQLIYPQTYLFAFMVCICVVTQMNYLNRVSGSFHQFSFQWVAVVINPWFGWSDHQICS
jgi:hypothetical protein